MDPQLVFEQAIACHKRGDLAQAEKHYRTLLLAYPGHEVVNHLMGLLYAQLERFAEAVSYYQVSLNTKPGEPGVLLDAGNAYEKLGQLDEALRCFETVLAAHPGNFQAMSNRGNILRILRRPTEALACIDAALALMPQDPQIQYNRVLTLHQMGRFAEAKPALDRLLALSSGHPSIFGEALESALHLGDWGRRTRLAAETPARVTDGITKVPPLTLMRYGSDPALLLRSARDTTTGLTPKVTDTLWSGEAYHHDRIRVAYLSFDFRIHPVANQLTQILETHDRTRFEIIGIAPGPDDGSETRARMIRALDQFHDVRMFTHRRIAETLRALEVDIVVDLNGHTEGACFPALAFRPCPVQATWLGYPGTTGAGFMDYLIADRIVAPLAQQQFYSEKLVHLPNSFFPMDTTRNVGDAPARAEEGLPRDGFVFCCFNTNWKIIPPVFDIWMKLLRDVPGSTLWLKDYGENLAAALRREAAARGVAPERLVFAKNAPFERHLARHRLADLFLDTLPYNAHATAADALWSGLPVLTQMGDIFPGRVCASLLTAGGLPELIALSPEEYEATALALARDPSRLKAIRDKLLANRIAAPLFDMTLFTRDLEAAYEKMLVEKT